MFIRAWLLKSSESESVPLLILSVTEFNSAKKRMINFFKKPCQTCFLVIPRKNMPMDYSKQGPPSRLESGKYQTLHKREFQLISKWENNLLIQKSSLFLNQLEFRPGIFTGSASISELPKSLMKSLQIFHFYQKKLE